MKRALLSLLFLSGFFVSQVNADVIVDLGNGTTGIGTGQLINGFTVDGTQFIAPASMAFPAGVSFTVMATGSNSNNAGGAVNNQAAGAGVAGGQAGSGIDNNFNNSANDPNFFETLTFQITNVTGGTVVFDGFFTDFGSDNGNMEYLSINGGAPTLIDTINDTIHSVPAASTFTVSAVPFSTQGVDSRFVVSELHFNIEATGVPEPGALVLMSSVATCLLLRRRRS